MCCFNYQCTFVTCLYNLIHRTYLWYVQVLSVLRLWHFNTLHYSSSSSGLWQPKHVSCRATEMPIACATQKKKILGIPTHCKNNLLFSRSLASLWHSSVDSTAVILGGSVTWGQSLLVTEIIDSYVLNIRMNVTEYFRSNRKNMSQW